MFIAILDGYFIENTKNLDESSQGLLNVIYETLKLWNDNRKR
jgi:hypothetical protein